MVYCIFAGNHEIEQQNGVLSNYLVSYRSRFKVTSCTSCTVKNISELFQKRLRLCAIISTCTGPGSRAARGL